MAKKETGLATKADAEILAELKGSYPTEPTFNRAILPRLSLVSVDVKEGRGKAMRVITEGGTFFKEKQAEKEVKDKDGKLSKPWIKKELGTEIEAIIIFERKQLKFYDGEKYISSPVYDTDDQIVPLFAERKEIDRGTPKELQSRDAYQGVSAKGKAISKLEVTKILYVLYENEVYQLNLRGSSMYSFMTYKRKISVSTNLTRMSSEAKENGDVVWNQMTFEAIREINAEESTEAVKFVREIKESIIAERAFYASIKPLTPKELAAKAGKTEDEDDDF